MEIQIAGLLLRLGDTFSVGNFGGASGYNIFTDIIDANGNQISYNTVP